MNNANFLGLFDFLSSVHRGILNNLIKAEKLLNLLKIKLIVRGGTFNYRQKLKVKLNLIILILDIMIKNRLPKT